MNADIFTSDLLINKDSNLCDICCLTLLKIALISPSYYLHVLFSCQNFFYMQAVFKLLLLIYLIPWQEKNYIFPEFSICII